MSATRAASGGNAETVRDVPEESLMLTGDENIVDINFTVFWVIQDAGDFLFNVQNLGTTAGSDDPRGGRKRHARSRRPQPDRADPDRQPRADPRRSAQSDAAHPRFLQRGRDRHARADAEGRSSGAGARSLSRRSGRAHRSGSHAQRSGSLCQRDRARSTRRCGAHHAAGRRLQAAGDGPGAGRSRSASSPSSISTSARPTSRAGASISRRCRTSWAT